MVAPAVSYQPIPDKTQVRSELIGTHVGQCELLEKIGDGRRGAVYRGRHAGTGREVAVKVMQDAVAEREVRAASHVHHPGLAEVLSFGRLPDGRHYVVMELIAGESADWVLHRRGPLTVSETVQVLAAVSEALSAAHDRGLFHGALHPKSVFLLARPEGGFTVKLLDFGVTPPPGEPEPSVAADLQALGKLGYTLLTGQLEVPAAPRSPIVPVMPLSLDELIIDLVQAASKLRPQSAREVRERLGPLLPQAPAAPAVVVSAAPLPTLPPRAVPHRATLPLIAAALVAAVGGAVAYLVLRPDAAPAEPVVVAAPALRPLSVAPVAVKPETPEPAPAAAPARAKASKSPRAAPVPTEDQLDARIGRLEGKLRGRPGSHDEAQHLLNKQRMRLGGTPDVDERRDIALKLDAWEQVWLR